MIDPSRYKKIAGLIIIAGIVLYILFFPNPVTNAPAAPLVSDAASGDSIVRVTGDSMSPAISNGDMATVRKVPYNTLEVNDVLLASNPGGANIIRRVASISSDGSLQVKSDSRPDLMNITEKDYLGKIVKISHKNGTVTSLP